MTQGFFALQDVADSRAPLPLLPQCGSCRLNLHCQSPKMPVDGQGKRKILVCGESPGKSEDEQGRPFVGVSGRLLASVLLEYGVDLRRDCWITNACVCHPESNKLPEKSVEYCRPNLVKIVNDYKPEVILLLGRSAIRSLIGWLWKEDTGKMDRWLGWKIPCQRLNAWIVPTWHPAYLLRSEGEKENKVAELLFRKHVKAACKLRGRPFETVPDYKRDVRVYLDPSLSAKLVRSYAEYGKPIAWDLETNMLKPDSRESEIYSCAISNGTLTISYPWHGEAIKATVDLLQSDVPKIGWNCKFEHRFALAKGIKVKNWLWDGMLAAHVLDNRGGISGLKFQSFVRLGMESYDEAISPYLKSDGSNTKNRIREAPLSKILTYNALDALLEFKIAQIQMKEMGNT